MTALPQALPAEQVPFPVSPRYLIRPDLRKLEPGSPRFLLDEAWPRYLERKLDLLEVHPEQCRVVAGDEEQVLRALRQVAGLIALEHPAHCWIDEKVIRLLRLGIALDLDGSVSELEGSLDPLLRRRARLHLEGLPPTARLADALALAVQEDLVLMAGPPGNDSAALLHVCFPSHWNPGARGGASFAQLHEPVPHNERLLAGSHNLLAAMLAKGPFIRFIWSLTPGPDLDQNPARPHRPAPSSGPLLDRLYFRSERQTTTALGELALFTIRIYLAPLRQMLDPQRAGLLAAAIRSMDGQLLRYKSLSEVREQLLQELHEIAVGEEP